MRSSLAARDASWVSGEAPEPGTYGAKTWWSLHYEFGSLKVRDRTTWSVHVNGDPVRLVGS